MEQAAITDSGASQDASVDLTVFYDGACPVCRAEINHYRGLDRARTVDWQDISILEDAALPADTNREKLLGRMHVLKANGEWAIGVDAFHAMWLQLQGFHRFAFLFKLPIVRPMVGVGYEAFLAWRRWRKPKAN